jgi:hypothetical protein
MLEAVEGVTMTEAEWLACGDQRRMLDLMGGWASERKLRLLAAACCRRVWPYLDSEEIRAAVEVVERLADGRAGREDYIRACIRARVATYQADLDRRLKGPWWSAPFTARVALRWASEPFSGCYILHCVVGVARAAAYWRAVPAASKYDPNHPAGKAGERAEWEALAGLIRCLIGPLPFRPVTADPAWLVWNNGTVPKIAQAAYDERLLPSGHLDPARLAVLADALEEAGCDDADILGHLRGPGPHVRDCWVVDLLLGKS